MSVGRKKFRRLKRAVVAAGLSDEWDGLIAEMDLVRRGRDEFRRKHEVMEVIADSAKRDVEYLRGRLSLIRSVLEHPRPSSAADTAYGYADEALRGGEG